MLVGLLPGVREFRTPLASGFLWLAAIWLTVSPLVPADTPDDGLLRDITTLQATLGQGATIATVTFLAYVLGVIMTISGASLPKLIAYNNRNFKKARAKAKPESKQLERIDRLEAKFTKIISSPLRTSHHQAQRITQRAIDRLRLGKTPFHRILEYFPELQVPFQARLELRPQTVQKAKRDADLELLRYNWFTEVKSGDLVDSIHWDVHEAAGALRTANRERYDDYDRTHAEGDFRAAICLPLGLLIFALGVRLAPFWQFWPYALSLVAIFVYAALRARAKEKVKEAHRIMIQAFYDEIIDPPSLAALKLIATDKEGVETVYQAEQLPRWRKLLRSGQSG